jgi:hypothetical protein
VSAWAGTRRPLLCQQSKGSISSGSKRACTRSTGGDLRSFVAKVVDVVGHGAVGLLEAEMWLCGWEEMQGLFTTRKESLARSSLYTSLLAYASPVQIVPSPQHPASESWTVVRRPRHRLFDYGPLANCSCLDTPTDNPPKYTTHTETTDYHHGACLAPYRSIAATSSGEAPRIWAL